MVVGAAVLSAVAGILVGGRLQSPADRAAERQAPRASRITVPVVRRTLSSRLTMAGEIAYAEPTPVKLAGAVGIASGETGVITRLPEMEQQVAEGDALFDVSGRPVFVLQGDLPTYRALGPGATGPDVQQLEAALARLGMDPGTVDTVYDAATEAAIERLYIARGYTAVGPSAEEDDRLRSARAAVTAANDAVTSAQSALDEAGRTASGAALLALQQAAGQARTAVTTAETTAARDDQAATAAVTGATSARDLAASTRDATARLLEIATAPGAIDPATGEPYTADEIETRRITANEAQAALAGAESALAAATAQQAATADAGKLAIQQAKDARTLADAQLADGTKAPDTTALRRALDAANANLAEMTADLAATEAAIGVHVPAGELVFVPTLPSTVTSVAGTIGAAPGSEAVATLSSSATQITGRVSRADTGLIEVGNTVRIELRDADVRFTGTIASIGNPPGSDGGGGRQQVVVAPDDPTAMADHVFGAVRIIVDIASTGGEVLAVPTAAVTVGGEGTSRVEVEDEPVTETDAGSTHFVEVEVGLSADGMVAVSPRGATLEAGDRVVVGTETGERRNAGATTSDPTGGEGDSG